MIAGEQEGSGGSLGLCPFPHCDKRSTNTCLGATAGARSEEVNATDENFYELFCSL